MIEIKVTIKPYILHLGSSDVDFITEKQEDNDLQLQKEENYEKTEREGTPPSSTKRKIGKDQKIYYEIYSIAS